ncbi:MAG: ABC transporter permease [Halothiobacillaceae bacterium]|nr:ABC transporter permease [Halothiobacillaceae bacterium]
MSRASGATPWSVVSGLALRGLWRELRGGSLGAMLLALCVAVAAVSAVAFFTDRVERGMQAQAGEFLAADRRLSSANAFDAALDEDARALGLRVARTLGFPSVIMAGEASSLVQIKAVGEGYPLRGRLASADAPGGAERDEAAGPAPGEVWGEARLFAVLGVQPGARLAVGHASLRLTRMLAAEPDAGGEFFQPAPTLMMNLADVPATGLVTPVSRVRHQLLLAGPDAALTRFAERTQARWPSGARSEGVEDARPEFRAALDRARQFLGLSAVVAVLLSGAALVLAARHYQSRQQDSAALMRALGASSSTILRLYVLRLVALGLAASVPGVLFGFLAQFGLAALMEGLLTVRLPAPGLGAVGMGLATAQVALLGFALPALVRLHRTPPLRVLRRDLPAPTPGSALLFAAALLAMGLLVLMQAREPTLALVLSLGLLGLLGVVYLAAWGALRLFGRLRFSGGARLGLAALTRHPHAGAAQLSALSLGLAVLLVLGVVRVDLLEAWRTQLPADAPNYFAINIQPDELPALQAFFAEEGIRPAGVYPMLRARLTAINERPVRGEDYADARAQRLALREFNLSWAAALPSDNRLLAGRWWTAGDSESGAFSIEEGIGERLGFGLGDRLRFDINGAPVEAVVRSVRSVQWDSMRPNFFVVAPPGFLDRHPAQYITSFHLPAGREETYRRLLERFPTLTLFDLDALLAQVRGVMDRATVAVQYVFLFTVLAGLTVLHAAFLSTRRERLREAALLRVLGARRRQVAGALLVEFLALGMLAAVLATLAASVLGMGLSVWVFELPWRFNAALPLWALAGGVGLTLLFVLGLMRQVVSAPPGRALR